MSQSDAISCFIYLFFVFPELCRKSLAEDSVSNSLIFVI